MKHRRLAASLVALAWAGAAVADEPKPDPLADGFRDPPASARPRTWWHWLNGNITEDGIDKDLEWMKRVGLGGVQAFDASLGTPQVVKDRIAYMTPAWKHAFKHAADTADRLGLELAIASSPGWSETGGPWVKPADAMKKLVWSETDVAGGKRFTARLAPPPGVTDAWLGWLHDATVLGLAYRIAVLVVGASIVVITRGGDSPIGGAGRAGVRAAF